MSGGMFKKETLKSERAAHHAPTRRRMFDWIPGTVIDDFLGPWVGVIALFVLGLVARNVEWGIHSTWTRVGQLFLTLAIASLLALVVRKYSESRHPFLRIHAVVSTYAYALVLSVTILVGAAKWWIWVLIYGGGTLALSWNIRDFNVFRSRGEDHHDADWNNDIGLDEGNLKRIRKAVTDAKRAGMDAVKVRVTVHGGKGFDHIVKALPGVNNYLQLPKGAVRAIEQPDEASNVADLNIVLRDGLKSDVKFPEVWDGVRRSIHEGLYLGRYEDGTLFKLLMTGGMGMEGSTAPSQTRVMGMSRAGKSHLFRCFVWQLSMTSDAVLWVIDTRKAGQTVRILLPAIDRLTANEDDARDCFEDVKAILIERGDWMAEHGLDEWEPGCGIPALIVWVEEGSGLLGQEWKELAQTSLSLGVFLVDSMQRASGKDVDTGARAQFANVLCFGVKTKADARFVLDDPQLIDRVAKWKNKRQGRFVAQVVGTDELHENMTIRSFWEKGRDYTNAYIESAIVRNAPGMARPDETITRASRPYVRPSAMDGAALDGVRPSIRGTVVVRPSARPPSIVDASPSVRRDAFVRAMDASCRPDDTRGGLHVVRPRDVIKAMDEACEWFDPRQHRPWVMGQLKEAVDRGELRRIEQGVYALTERSDTIN